MPIATRILLIDPRPVLAESLSALFAQHGEFAMDHVISMTEAIAQLAGHSAPDIVLLSDDAGAAAHNCKALRQSGFRSPILILTDETGSVPGTDLAEMDAQDALQRPFRYGVLVARLRQLVRVHEQSEDATFLIGPHLFRPSEKILVSGTDEVRLTDKEAAILKALHRAGGRVVTRETLLDEVWGYNSGITTHTLETHIYRLRQKLEPSTNDPSFLLTDQGGYRLIDEDAR